MKNTTNKKFNHKLFFLVALTVIVLLVAGYIAYDTWLTNSRAQAVLTSSPTPSTDTTEWSKDDEGKDETEVPKSALSSYTVAPSLPRALYIDKLNIAARVMPMAVNADNSIQAPKNIFDSGWYSDSAKPGEAGAVFIDGHASGATRQGLFAYLDTLKMGDTVQIEKGNGEKLNYKVVQIESVSLADVDMSKALKPYGNASKGLNLMTCTGKWLPKEKTYDHRVIVYTEQV
jgi:LPXTG-site transpeptidase (sortase) family protein